MKTAIIVPARYHSTRYKGKPLAKILGREMVLRVADTCSKVVGKNNLYIATDSKKIEKVVSSSGYKCIFTSKKCLTGTDRVAEASKKINSNLIINVQGDEPLIKPNDIKKIIDAKRKYPNEVICGYNVIQKNEDPANKNIPKVVINKNNNLIYISRSLVPGSIKKTNNVFYKQVCIYAFNKKELHNFYNVKKKSYIESIEDIEILRFFDLGVKIKMIKINSKSKAVDTIKDKVKVEKILLKNCV